MIGKMLFSIVVMLITSGIFNQNVSPLKASENDTLNLTEKILTESEKHYRKLSLKENASLPSFEAFDIAYKGFSNLKKSAEVKKDILTIIDFSLSSNEKRLWIIDLNEGKVLFNDWVAHGRNSGNKFAKTFSNVPNTNMSSIGFFVTGETYYGKHGLSLFLNGKDKLYNTNARRRAIVMHGADYVSGDFIKKYGRLGRSFGCPSVSMDIYENVIDTIRDGSLLFIYYPDNDFLKKSDVLNLAG